MVTTPQVSVRLKFRKVVCVLASLLGVVFLIFISHFSADDDPVYKGKPLSHWLVNMGGLDALPRLPPMGEEDVSEYFRDRQVYRKKFGDQKGDAHDALIDLGEKAFPLLLHMLATSDHPSSRTERLKQSIGDFFAEHQLATPQVRMSRMQASQAFAELQWAGCDLKYAMPSIKRLQKHSEADVRVAAVFLSEFLERESHRMVRMALRTNSDVVRSQ